MRRTVSLATTLIAGWILLAAAQQPSVLPMGPARERGASVTPGLRRLVQERRRQLQPADRLLQPQFERSR